jgi:hypothetical protein
MGSCRVVCDHGFTHACVDAIDIDAEYERLKAAGMTFRCSPHHLVIWGGSEATIHTSSSSVGT